MWHVLLFATLQTLCSLWALIRGGGPERAAALALLFAYFGTMSLGLVGAGHFLGAEMSIGAVDVALFLTVTAIAIFANRFWPIWMAGLLGIGLVAHVVMLLTNTIVPKVYAIAVALSGYPVLLILVLGTERHRRRLRRYEIDASWKGFSPFSDDNKRGPVREH